MKTGYYIGEVARYQGVSADTLRLYERKSVLPLTGLGIMRFY